jgi:hypothetical protein
MLLRTASFNMLADGTGASLPDSSLNILQEIPGISPGRISTPLIRTEGDPIKLFLLASSSLIL